MNLEKNGHIETLENRILLVCHTIANATRQKHHHYAYVIDIMSYMVDKCVSVHQMFWFFNKPLFTYQMLLQVTNVLIQFECN